MYYCKFFFFFFLSVSLLLFMLSNVMMANGSALYIEYMINMFDHVSMVFVAYFDWMSLLFMSVVLFISSMIMKYSSEYMYNDYNIQRFIILVVLFVISMMFVILSLNLFSILIGWDGLGLVSYALVIFYQNSKSYNAGMLTALMNRVGDVALLLCIAMMIKVGDWNFMFLYSNDNTYWAMMMIILASMTKSAQMPFSSWLPAAMAAPTPVSSLVHSSTLVTAGVYFLIRSGDMLGNSSIQILLFSSLFTMFMAGLCANYEYDLKKIIAFSTLSQLGLMISMLSLGNIDLSFFHLLTHALFKALLFMCAGVLIHNMGNCQDIRFMGGMVSIMPFTMTCMNICNFALCGVPFMSGFYSKDLILDVLSMKYLNLLVYIVYFLSIGLTVSYTLRMSYYIFWGDLNTFSMSSLGDKGSEMFMSMFGLVYLVIFFGSYMMWVSLDTPYLIILPLFMKLMTLFIISIGLLVGLEIGDLINSLMFSYLKFLGYFMANMWNFNILFVYKTNMYMMSVGKTIFKNMDQGWFEYYGKSGLEIMFVNIIKFIQKLSENNFKSFYVFILILMLFILFV
uniref:NADH-ubiquinone oxidoreductase chain 5 n=1 Tax=Xyloterini sp. TaxID=2995406 RepID=A0A9E8G9L4_9CUCU|nr:NADH dehydrogenase subunit 5 [Xyloterini sp.]